MKFIEEYGFYIFVALCVIVLLGVFGVPLFIGMARAFWHWALM